VVGEALVATVAVNLVGCLAVGLLVGRGPGERERALLGTGFLGGLTTMSTAALQAVESPAGAVCLVGSAVAGVALCRLGLRLGSQR
jgi:fluoride exporter